MSHPEGQAVEAGVLHRRRRCHEGNVREPSRSVAQALGPLGLPITILVDADHRPIPQIIGAGGPPAIWEGLGQGKEARRPARPPRGGG